MLLSSINNLPNFNVDAGKYKYMFVFPIKIQHGTG